MEVAQSTEGQNTPTASLQKGNILSNECPGYDTRQSDGEAPALKIWGIRSISFIAIAPRSILGGCS